MAPSLQEDCGPTPHHQNLSVSFRPQASEATTVVMPLKATVSPLSLPRHSFWQRRRSSCSRFITRQKDKLHRLTRYRNCILLREARRKLICLVHKRSRLQWTSMLSSTMQTMIPGSSCTLQLRNPWAHWLLCNRFQWPQPPTAWV